MPTQHELNSEIESFIRKKDGAKFYFKILLFIADRFWGYLESFSLPIFISIGFGQACFIPTAIFVYSTLILLDIILFIKEYNIKKDAEIITDMDIITYFEAHPEACNYCAGACRKVLQGEQC